MEDSGYGLWPLVGSSPTTLSGWPTRTCCKQAVTGQRGPLGRYRSRFRISHAQTRGLARARTRMPWPVRPAAPRRRHQPARRDARNRSPGRPPRDVRVGHHARARHALWAPPPDTTPARRPLARRSPTLIQYRPAGRTMRPAGSAPANNCRTLNGSGGGRLAARRAGAASGWRSSPSPSGLTVGRSRWRAFPAKAPGSRSCYRVREPTPTRSRVTAGLQRCPLSWTGGMEET